MVNATADREAETLNALAREQINQLAANGIAAPQSSFWQTDYSRSLRPSNEPASWLGYSRLPGTTAGISRLPLANSGYGQAHTPEGIHKRFLYAIYKNKTVEGEVVQKTTTLKRPKETTDLSPFEERMYNKLSPREEGVQRAPRQAVFGPGVRTQMSAIAMSGVAKMVTALVFNWAKMNQVPPELLY